ncbi:putative nuclease HARBI1 [Cinnamomum micranthum f. kanehirae]|uniref:Putative nuclease HARBI1 n=1 Tax=Cinnamomum micranthum f. kanehirae TaxID=337451 RepID=A0A3S3PHJ3_9MAGN|nr:putative nuclease HARBI1 [Cinnamomum micranthum f. kanehirae]
MGACYQKPLVREEEIVFYRGFSSVSPNLMHTLKPFNIIKGKSLPDWASLAIIFGDSVADGRDEFASNDPELVEAEADDDKGLTQADEMDNDCIGAIDGTHIPARVRLEDYVRYRNKKGFLSQNVMAAVSFDMKFQYVFTGWEGSASDSKILQNALSRPYNRIQVPTGKFYLVDGGYANTRGFVAPYRDIRYHLKEWSTTQALQTPQELFNLRHSKACNVVERTFAVLKQRFPILKTTPRYPLNTQAKIVVACCIMYNYIKQWNYNDELEEGSVLEMDVDENINVKEDTEVGSVPSDVNTDLHVHFEMQLLNNCGMINDL